MFFFFAMSILIHDTKPFCLRVAVCFQTFSLGLVFGWVGFVLILS